MNDIESLESLEIDGRRFATMRANMFFLISRPSRRLKQWLDCSVRLATFGLGLGTASNGLAIHKGEYLQSSVLSIAKDHVRIQIHLTPGTDVSRQVISMIDTDRDGNLSPTEQAVYAANIKNDLVLAVNGRNRDIAVVTYKFPAIREIEKGLGEISVILDAPIRSGARVRKLVFENHHLPAFSAYSVNSFVPDSQGLALTGQKRDLFQTHYQATYLPREVAPLRKIIKTQRWQIASLLSPLLLLLLMRKARESPPVAL